MSAWQLVPCLAQLRAEFNAIAPSRDHASDGGVADAAHSPSSDHSPDEDSPVLRGRDPDSRNEVHAIDVDAGLNVAGLDMLQVVLFLVGRCVRGQENRLGYIIHKQTIWSATHGWIGRRYDGASPHVEHAHFSATYAAAREADTRSWHLEDIPVALTADDKAWLADKIDKAATLAAQRVWATSWKQEGDGPVKSAATMLSYAPSRGQVEQVSKTCTDILAAVADGTPPAAGS